LGSVGEVWSALDPRLVFDGVKDVIDGDPEWNEIGLCLTSLVRLGCTPSWLVDNEEL